MGGDCPNFKKRVERVCEATEKGETEAARKPEECES